MSRMTLIKWQTLKCIFEKVGFEYKSQGPNNIILEKENFSRPIIIPKFKDVGVKNIALNIRIAKMTKDKYFLYLNECK